MRIYSVSIYDGIRAQAQPARIQLQKDRLAVEVLYPEEDPLYDQVDAEEAQRLKELSEPRMYIPYSELSPGAGHKVNGVTSTKRHVIIESDDPKIRALLKQKINAERLFIVRWINTLNPTNLVLVSALTLVCVGALYLNLYRLIPIQQEEALGKLIIQQATSELVVCEDDTLQAELEQMIVGLQEPDDEYPIKVTIFKNPTPNAFAVMGGQLGVFSGLLEQSESREEVIGILAHELGHVKHQHSLRNMLRAIGVSVLVSVFFGDLGFEGIETLGELGSGFLIFKYSRDYEREADQEAATRLRRRKISTLPLAHFMEKIGGESAVDLSWMTTHPNPRARSLFFKQQNNAPKPAPSDSWDRVKTRCSP